MLKKTLSLTPLLLLAACATRPAPQPVAEETAPVVITESAPTLMAPATDTESSANQDAPDAPRKPAQTDSGRFRISVASIDNAESTAAWVKKAEAAGYRAEVLEVVIDGKSWHRVLLPGYASLADAQAALPFVQQDLAAPGAWVTSRRRAPAPDGAAAAPAPDAPPPPPSEMPAPEQPAN
jgi:cell division septation protein DedD